MKLKTLKDLRKYKRKGLLEGVNVKHLKKEAIKWVKKDLKDINNNPLLKVERIVSLNLVNRWIKRFNITEEDLIVYKDNQKLNEKERKNE